MDHKEEYHDPDYPETSRNVKQEAPCVSEEDRISRIKSIIRREFSNELELRENEVMLIDQRASGARRLLHRLRLALVAAFYCDQRLQASSAQLALDREMASGQRRLHPSVRKLLGRRTADLDEIFGASQRRALPRRDYSAMVQKRSYSYSAAAAGEASSPQPAGEGGEGAPAGESEGGAADEKGAVGPAPSVLTLGPATRNKAKQRYRIIVGNTSRYAPGASAADRATHWWLLYVRGPAGADGSRVLRHVTVRLHASYAPHHTVRLRPPYRLARRGWGEFDARLELAFALPDRNPPASLSHTIRLDARRTGLQTLGSETVVDVWLYSSPDMLQHAFVEPAPAPAPAPGDHAAPAPPPPDCGWSDLFAQDTTELDVDEMIIKPIKKEIKEESDLFPETVGETADLQSPDWDREWDREWEQEWERDREREREQERNRDRARDLPDEILTRTVSPKKRIMKYIDPTTGKIYYLEMDRELDLTKVREIVIDDTKASIAPLGNGLERRAAGARASRRHVDNDHCYCGVPPARGPPPAPRLRSARAAVDLLLRRLPLPADDRYWRLDVAKRRNIEWSRAKLINRLVRAHVPDAWSTKQILVYSRLHGYYPTRPAPAAAAAAAPSPWGGAEGAGTGAAGLRRLFPAAAQLCSLSLFDAARYEERPAAPSGAAEDEPVDVERPPRPPPPAAAPPPPAAAAATLPAAGEDERLRFLYIERKCADIGIELRNEDIGHGYQYSAVHCVLLSAVRSFAEELIRTALACRLADEKPGAWPGQPSGRPLLCLEHVYAACGGGGARGRGGGGPEAGGGGGSGAGGGGGLGAGGGGARSPGGGRLAVLSARALASRRKDTAPV